MFFNAQLIYGPMLSLIACVCGCANSLVCIFRALVCFRILPNLNSGGPLAFVYFICFSHSMVLLSMTSGIFVYGF